MSSKSHLRPDFEAELRHALGRLPDDLAANLAEILLRQERLSPGLRRALAFLCRDDDPEFELHIKRRRVGRPSGRSDRTPPASEVQAFLREHLERGELLKNVVADACTSFGISRSTVYRLKDEAERKLEEERKRKLVETALRKAAGGAVANKSKSAARRRKRRRIPKKVRSYRLVKLYNRESWRAERRSRRLSQKRREISD